MIRNKQFRFFIKKLPICFVSVSLPLAVRAWESVGVVVAILNLFYRAVIEIITKTIMSISQYQ